MYTQDQINVLEDSYLQENNKLLRVKGNYALAVLSLKTQISEKDKKIADLEKKILELTPKKKEMKKLTFLIPLIIFFACKNEPDQPETDVDTVIIQHDTAESLQPRAMERAAGPIIDSTKITPNGDTVVYGHTVETVNFTYDKPFVIVKLKGTVTPPTNTAPVARAGADQVLTLPTNSTKLDGSASTDAENNIKTYGWRKVSGPTATITDSNKPVATIANLLKGSYVYELRVADQLNLFTADRVRITVQDGVTPPQNQPPVARAAANPSSITLPVTTVSLTAAASTDADGTIASWLWEKRSGPPANIQNPTNATTSVSGLTPGTYQFSVTVKDNLGAEDQETVNVTVNSEIVIPPDGNPVPFSLNSIPTSDPDLNNAGRGVEQWHSQNMVNVPSEGTNTQRLDVYYRSPLTWAKIEKSKNNYDWGPVINILNNAISKRQKVTLGIMSVYHDREDGVIEYDGGLSSYPQYLHQEMQGESAKDWKTSYGGWVPNYNSPKYLDAQRRINTSLNNLLETGSNNGVRYKDIINSIDVRGYGNYGEWHNGGIVDVVSQIPSAAHATTASLKAIIDAHTQTLPNFQLSIIMTAFDANWLQHTKTSPEVAYYALTTSNAYGKLGWRRDNWGATDNYIRDLLENNTRTWNGVVLNSLIMNVWKYAPVTGELMNTAPNEYGDLERQVRLYHAASFGNGNINQSVTTGVKNSVRAGSKASGYRLISTGGTYQLGANSITIKNNWQNIGIAPNYDNWNIVYEMVSSSGAVTAIGNSNFKLRLFLPGSTSHSDTFPLNLPSGTYTLRMVVKDPTGYRPPLQLAIQGRNSDGSYNLKTGIQR